VAAAFLLCSITIAVAGEWKLESKDGGSSVKLGFLVQARAEFTDLADDGGTARDLYFRRLRLMAGGKLTDRWTFFLETDSPGLGKGNAASDVFIQDFVVTYHHAKNLMVDVGLLLVPLAHNSNQSAVTLLPVDYGAYSFLNSAPTRSRVGRDYGISVRSYLANDHLEVRLGVYDGWRGEDSTNGLRWVGRVAWYPFEIDRGFFYTGTTLGKKRILAIGAGFDKQEDYLAWSADVFWDQPLRGGNAITFQAQFVRYDGDTFFPSLPPQDTWTVEAGYLFGATNFGIFATWLTKDPDDPGIEGEDRWQAGVAFYPAGYSRVLKVAWGRIRPDDGEDVDQFIVQLQLFHF